MKRLLVAFFSLALILCVSACDGESDEMKANSPDFIYERCNDSGTPDENGEYLLFGSFPQTLKDDGVTVGTVADSRGYYLGSDGEYYAAIKAVPYDSRYTFSNGDIIEKDKIYYFKVEPIRWRILSEGEGDALILCDSIIANMAYQPTYSEEDGEYYTSANGAPHKTYSNSYEYSEVRRWLINDFYDVAFNGLQAEIILPTSLDNSIDSTGYDSNPYASGNLTDKVFLLSYKDITNENYGFFSDSETCDAERKIQTNDYSRATGAWMDSSSRNFRNGWWMLRSPDATSSHNVREVKPDGTCLDVNYVGDFSEGVVPALRISLDK